VNRSPDKGFRVPSDQIAHERLDGSVIAINLTTGTYFNMSGTAADAWTLLSQGATIQAVSTTLEQMFDCEAVIADVGNFVDQCVEFGLLEFTEAQSAPCNLPEDWSRETWVAPMLEVYNDLQDLILIDPIHDASVVGWPEPKQQSTES
jgi:hypothetical protein